jgi:hypothetical protein
MLILSDSQTGSIVGKTDPQNLLFPDFALPFSLSQVFEVYSAEIRSFEPSSCYLKHQP